MLSYTVFFQRHLFCVGKIYADNPPILPFDNLETCQLPRFIILLGISENWNGAVPNSVTDRYTLKKIWTCLLKEMRRIVKLFKIGVIFSGIRNFKLWRRCGNVNSLKTHFKVQSLVNLWDAREFYNMYYLLRLWSQLVIMNDSVVKTFVLQIIINSIYR